MSYKLVVDNRTKRVIFFTSDADYKLLDDEHSFLASVESLPEGIALANCWRYKLINGNLELNLQSASGPVSATTVLESNKIELTKMLDAKCKSVWEAIQPWSFQYLERYRGRSHHIQDSRLPIQNAIFNLVDGGDVQSIQVAINNIKPLEL
jgi:hypothetical protein